MAECRRRLRQLTHADDVQILLGSGTLANDAIAQQLRLCGSPGLVLSNGEFGDRLVDHARRAGLAHRVHRARWGAPFDYGSLRAEIADDKPPAWMWMVHCETSTGVLNHLEEFKTVAANFGADAVLDCISSMGNVDLDLSDIAFASGVSGKGLAAPAGLAFVFHRRNGLGTGPLVPRYLDLAFYAAHQSVPFTQSSNLLSALEAALDAIDPRDFARRAVTSTAVREALRHHRFQVVGSSKAPAPFVVTIELPPVRSSVTVGEAMLACGFQIAFQSGYLKSRNWIQIAWMGAVTAADALGAIETLAGICGDINEPRETHSLPHGEASRIAR